MRRQSSLHVQMGSIMYRAAGISIAEAERLEPELGAVYIARAKFAWLAGQHDEAVGHCRTAAERDPMRFAASAWQLAADIYDSMGRPAEAAAARRRAAEAGNP